MIREKEDNLLEMALAIADDQTISKVKERSDVGSRLRQLDTLADAFRGGEGEDQIRQKERSEPLFEWGHLLVMEHIGQGSFGDVYRAFDPSLQCEVALKLWNKDRCGYMDENYAIEEARRLARVRHPNVLAVQGAGIHRGQAGFWADLLDGETLRDLYKKDSGIGLGEVLHIGIALASALDAVHQAGLVHGDIKPANVMKEAGGRVVLMDFGAGRDLQKGDWSLTPGTPAAMAPEVFSGDMPNDQSDMYSLGVLFYFLLTGRYPISAKGLDGFVKAHREGFRPNVSRQRAGLPRAMVKLVERLLDPKPDRRPSAAQVCERLRWIQERPQRRIRNVLLAAIACSLILGTAASTWNFFRAKRAAGQAEIAKNHTVKVNQFLQEMLASPAPSLKGRNVKMIEILNQAARDAKQQFADQPQALASIRFTLGVTYRSLGVMEKARHQLEQCLALRQSILGPNHPDSLEAKIWLGDVLAELARSREAENLLLEALSTSQRVHGPSHEVTLRAQTKLASVTWELNRPREAVEMVQAVLARWEENKLDSPAKYHAIQELGSQLIKLGEFQNAIEVNRQVAAWFLKEQGEDHPDTIVARKHLATSFSRFGDLEKAEIMLAELTGRSNRVLGPNHFETLAILNNWGSVLNERGKYAEAGARFQQVYERSVQTLGAHHPKTLRVMGNLANVLRYGGYASEALELQRKTLKLQTEALSREHPATLMTMLNLAELWVENGQPERGEQLACEAYDFLITSFGPDHLFALEALDIMGTAFADLGFVMEAEAIHREVLRKKRVFYGKSQPILILTLDRIVMVLEKMGYHGELITLYEEIHGTYLQMHGPNHPLTHKAKLDLDQSLVRVQSQKCAMTR